MTIGTPDELGRSGLVSTSIADSDIKTPAAAAEHIRNGGSIEGVPRELILEAALKNSSADEKDESKLFRLVTVDEDGKPGAQVGGGTQGTSYIFLKRDPDGRSDSAPGTEQGFIIKSFFKQKEFIKMHKVLQYGFLP